MKEQVTVAAAAERVGLDHADAALVPKLDTEPVRCREAHRFERHPGSPRPDGRRRRPSGFLVGLEGDSRRLFGLGSAFKPIEQPRQFAPELLVERSLPAFGTALTEAR